MHTCSLCSHLQASIVQKMNQLQASPQLQIRDRNKGETDLQKFCIDLAQHYLNELSKPDNPIHTENQAIYIFRTLF